MNGRGAPAQPVSRGTSVAVSEFGEELANAADEAAARATLGAQPGSAAITDDGNSGAAATIDFSANPHHKLTLTDACTLTFTAPAAGVIVTLRLIQDGTGGRIATFPGSVVGTVGYNITAASAVVLTFLYDGANYILLGSSYNGAIPNALTLTLASDALTIPAYATAPVLMVLVAGEGGVADTCSAIAGGLPGQVLVVRAADSSVDITMSAAGTLFLAGGASFTLDNTADTVELIQRQSGVWLELGRAHNGG